MSVEHRTERADGSGSASGPAVRRASAPVTFHRLTDEYGAFTNFARYPILLDGHLWPTAEHYFQAAKFTDTEHAGTIRRASSPSLAARLGRSRDVPLRPDWAEARVDVMRRAVTAKFTQYPSLAVKLAATGSRPLVEDTRRDFFWGAGADGTGRNTNGLLLMELRDRIHALHRAAEDCRRLLPEPAARRPWVLFAGGVAAVPRRTREPLLTAALRLLQAHPAAAATTGHRVLACDLGELHRTGPDDGTASAAAPDPEVRGVHDPLNSPLLWASEALR
ncbi:NADAR family protein [Kitasatospora sp. NPDC058965]|uniref:NADAR family protein n=1 Tax=Kitasatospora sp. NPDC058965 TaxID=3346682 RepID=UPI0036B6192C